MPSFCTTRSGIIALIYIYLSALYVRNMSIEEYTRGLTLGMHGWHINLIIHSFIFKFKIYVFFLFWQFSNLNLFYYRSKIKTQYRIILSQHYTNAKNLLFIAFYVMQFLFYFDNAIIDRKQSLTFSKLFRTAFLLLLMLKQYLCHMQNYCF